MSLFDWGNLPFLVPMAVSLTWFVASNLLGLDGDDGDLELEGELDGDLEVDVDDVEAPGVVAEADQNQRVREYEATKKAEARRKMVEAESAIDPALLVRDVMLEAVRKAPDAIEAFMAPATSISDVKVVQLHGMEGSNGDGAQQQGLPGMIAGSLAQTAGLLPVITTLTDFAKDAGLVDRAKEVAAEAAEVVRKGASGDLNGGGKATPAPTPSPAPKGGRKPRRGM